MKDFIEKRTFVGTNDDFLRVKARGVYLELEINRGYENSFYCYFVQKSNYSIWILCSFGAHIDWLWDDDVNWKIISDTWPSTFQSVKNGLDEKYSNGALIKFIDPDTEDKVSVVTTIAGNIDFNDEDSILSETNIERASKMIDLASTINNELETKKPSIGKQFVKGALTGIGLGILGVLSS